jgi:DNA processing protein
MVNFIIDMLCIPGIGKRTLEKVIQVAGFEPTNIDEIIDVFIEAKDKYKRIKIPERYEIEKAKIQGENIRKKAYDKNINIISFKDKGFPESLKCIPDFPVLLYYKGNLEAINNTSIAIVGTRNPTIHGEKVAGRLGEIFGKRGFTVVTGLALGCDTFANLGSLKVNGLNVVSLPCGIDSIYPKENEKLAYDIIEKGGCIISEYPPGENAKRNYFVERDRLQSGLSKVVVVVETDLKGGTMHTAKFALEQERKLYVYAPPYKNRTLDIVSGNIELLKDNRVKSLENKNDIENIEKVLLEYDYSNFHKQEFKQVNFEFI